MWHAVFGSSVAEMCFIYYSGCSEFVRARKTLSAKTNSSSASGPEVPALARLLAGPFTSPARSRCRSGSAPGNRRCYGPNSPRHAFCHRTTNLRYLFWSNVQNINYNLTGSIPLMTPHLIVALFFTLQPNKLTINSDWNELNQCSYNILIPTLEASFQDFPNNF